MKRFAVILLALFMAPLLVVAQDHVSRRFVTDDQVDNTLTITGGSINLEAVGMLPGIQDNELLVGTSVPGDGVYTPLCTPTASQKLHWNGSVSSCPEEDATQAELDAQDECTEITGCVPSAITSAGVTYENLDANADIGFGAAQVPQGSLTAPLASPTFTGNPLGPTPPPEDNDTSLATTEFVIGEVADFDTCAEVTGCVVGAITAEVNDLETDDPASILANEVYVGTGPGAGAFTALQDCADGTESLDWNGSVFVCNTITGGSASNSFETWNVDLGVNPVADGSTDTIQVTSAIALALTGATTPDSLTLDFDYSNEMVATDIPMAADECLLRADAGGLGGGFVCEGTTADANEREYLFPDVAGADDVFRIAVDDKEVTDLEGAGLSIAAGTLDVDHDAANNFLTAEHVDWAGASAGTIHTDNYIEGGAGTDLTAIHDDTPSEISAITLKGTPVSGDFLLIEDSAAGNAKKRITVGSLPGGGGLWTDSAGEVHPTTTTNDVCNDAACSNWRIQDTGEIVALSYGGITEADLLDKSAVETISGAWAFGGLASFTNAGTVDFAGQVTASGFRADATPAPGIGLDDSDEDDDGTDDVGLFGNCPTEGECDAILWVDGLNDARTGMWGVDTTAAGVVTLWLGAQTDVVAPWDPPANRIEISEGGDMTAVAGGSIEATDVVCSGSCISEAEVDDIANLTADALDALSEIAAGIKTNDGGGANDNLAIFTQDFTAFGGNRCVEITTAGALVGAAGVCAAAGGGDIDDVGPGYPSGAAFTDGLVSIGSVLLVWEGTVNNTDEFRITVPADPDFDMTLDFTQVTAPRTYTVPDAGGEFSLLGQSIQSSEADATFVLDTESPTAADVAGTFAAGLTIVAESVSAAELNAGGVEAELEAVLDLADLQEKDIDSLVGQATIAAAYVHQANVEISDGAGDSPLLRITGATITPNFDLFAADVDDDLRLEVNTTGTENLEIINVGTGILEVFIETSDGTLTSLRDAAHLVTGSVPQARVGDGHILQLAELSPSLCASGEILERQGSIWACITTPTGGAETNSLEVAMTGVLSGEIPIGTTAGGVAAYVSWPPCGNDAKPEYLDGAPDTIICEDISGLTAADLSGEFVDAAGDIAADIVGSSEMDLTAAFPWTGAHSWASAGSQSFFDPIQLESGNDLVLEDADGTHTVAFGTQNRTTSIVLDWNVATIAECDALGNNGKLTIDTSGFIVCAADVSGGAGLWTDEAGEIRPTDSTDHICDVADCTGDYEIADTGEAFFTQVTAAAVAIPMIRFDDTIAAGVEARIVGDATADNNGELELQVEDADGVYKIGLQIKSTAGAVVTKIGGDATSANHFAITEAGAMTTEGTATFDGLVLSTIIQTELDELATLDGTSISTGNWTALSNLTNTNSGDNDEVGTVTDAQICQGDGTDVQCDITSWALLVDNLSDVAVDATEFSQLATLASTTIEDTDWVALGAFVSSVLPLANSHADLALATGDTFTGTHDFTGATDLLVELNAALALGASGAIGIDTTDEQFQFRSGANTLVVSAVLTVCKTLESPVEGDDDVPFFIAPEAITIVETACHINAGTITSLTFQDSTDNDVDAPTCSTSDVTTWDAAMSGTATLTKGEGLEFDISTPAGITWLEACVRYTIDAL